MSKHKKHHTGRPPARREQFQPSAARGARVSPTTAVMGVTVVLAAVLVYLIASSARGTARAAPTEIAVAGGDVTLPVATFGDGQARFYRYVTAGGRELKFFVLRSSDGVVRAAFDACDTCYRERKGYHQEGDAMVCNNCGRRFRSVDVNVIQGGCNPAPLERTVVGDQLVLKAASLELGAGYF